MPPTYGYIPGAAYTVRFEYGQLSAKRFKDAVKLVKEIDGYQGTTSQFDTDARAWTVTLAPDAQGPLSDLHTLATIYHAVITLVSAPEPQPEPSAITEVQAMLDARAEAYFAGRPEQMSSEQIAAIVRRQVPDETAVAEITAAVQVLISGRQADIAHVITMQIGAWRDARRPPASYRSTAPLDEDLLHEDMGDYSHYLRG